MASATKLLRLPAHGRLLACADLRGNLRDFLQVVHRFEQLPASSHLLFLGDLLHGPYLSESEWSQDLGRYYRDASPAILLKLSLLQEKWPGRVHALLGNHEHAHLGGPRTARFCADEALVLEQRLSSEAAAWLQAYLLAFPLLALAPCGLLFSHGAPGAVPDVLEDLEALNYHRYLPLGDAPPSSSTAQDAPARLLGQLLWTRSLAPATARMVLLKFAAQVLVYGREVVRGSEAIGKEQLILSSSFGLHDEDKRILMVDLDGTYRSTDDLREGIEIKPLY